MSKTTKVTSCVVLLVLCAVVLLVRAYYARNMAIISRQGVSIRDVRRAMDKEVPIGTSKNQIEKWFKRKGINYGYLDAKKGQLKYEPLAKQSGIPKQQLAGILTARISGASDSIFKCHSYLFFIIDKKGKSVKHDASGACLNPLQRIEI